MATVAAIAQDLYLDNPGPLSHCHRLEVSALPQADTPSISPFVEAIKINVGKFEVGVLL